MHWNDGTVPMVRSRQRISFKVDRRLATFTPMNKAIVLVSGGIDSTVALWWAKRQGWRVIPLTMNYHARPRAEKSATRRILDKAGIKHLVEVPLGFVKEVGDLAKEGGSPGFLDESPEGYIPARNMIFYSIAAYYAEFLDARFVVGGHNETDPQEFPDSSPEFFRNLNRLMAKGLWSYAHRPVKVLVPLRHKKKLQVVRLGMKLGAPIHLTWSCRHDGRRPCGECSSCIERDEAFRLAGLHVD